HKNKTIEQYSLSDWPRNGSNVQNAYRNVCYSILYLWEQDEERQVAKYILKNNRKMYVESLEEKPEMLNELASVVRASNSCHLVFESSN
ncbi:hypothetical protein HID58_016651, partial [Brassica napus]